MIPIGTVLPYAGPIADADKAAQVEVNLAALPDQLAVTTRRADKATQIEVNLARVGWLLCDGSSLPCAEYFQLYGVIGMAFGGNAEANTFNLPDLRGRFLRGVDVQSGGARDPDSGARTASADGGNTGNKVGSLQLDAFQGHEHQYIAVIEAGTAPAAEGPPSYAPNTALQPTRSDVADTDNHDTPRISSETRPVNLYLNFIIRYR